MTTWNKQTSTILAQKSAAVLWHCYRSKDKIPRTLKTFVCKLLRFLLRRRFCRQNWYYAQHYTSSISRYFHYSRASRSQKGKILRWNKHAGQQADPVRLWVFTACKQLKNRGTKCAFILVVVRPMVVQSSFHTEFLSSIRFSPLRLLQRRKRTKSFCVFVRTWRRAKAKLANSKS